MKKYRWTTDTEEGYVYAASYRSQGECIVFFVNGRCVFSIPLWKHPQISEVK